MNVDLTAADIRAAGPDGAAGNVNQDTNQAAGSSMRPNGGGTQGIDRGASQRDNAGGMAPNSSGRMAPNSGGADGMDGGRVDENGDMQGGQGQRRSIISSIR